MNTISKINTAIYKDPSLIEELYKSPNINNGFLTRVLKKAIPCRIGIEFEYSDVKPFLFGFKNKYGHENFLEVYKVIDVKSDDIDDVEDHATISTPDIEYLSHNTRNICNFYIYYNSDTNTFTGYSYNDSSYVFDYETETPVSLEEREVESNGCTPGYCCNDLTEIRFSFNSFKHLVYLQKFLQDMNEFCELDKKGGIHIHLDMLPYIATSARYNFTIKNYLTNRLSEIEHIFPKYTGKYNYREVGIRSKRTYVNISRLNTLEFRIAPLTFSYSVLMGWIKDLIKFRSKLITDIFGHSKKIK